eukprot:8251632-Alexandrium_andersonii.AAC.1
MAVSARKRSANAYNCKLQVQAHVYFSSHCGWRRAHADRCTNPSSAHTHSSARAREARGRHRW